MRNYKLSYLYEAALIPMEQRKHLDLVVDNDGVDLKEFKQLSEIQKTVCDFVSKGKQLYIHSQNTGTGKTSWALRLCQAYLNQVWPTSKLECRVLFINTPKLLLSLKENISEKNEYASYIKDNILEADLVVWDDISTKTATSFEAENLFSMIDMRLSSGKANIYTSNLNRDELHECMGDRLASRICTASVDIEFRGKDKRGINKEN